MISVFIATFLVSQSIEEIRRDLMNEQIQDLRSSLQEIQSAIRVLNPDQEITDEEINRLKEISKSSDVSIVELAIEIRTRHKLKYSAEESDSNSELLNILIKRTHQHRVRLNLRLKGIAGNIANVESDTRERMRRWSELALIKFQIDGKRSETIGYLQPILANQSLSEDELNTALEAIREVFLLIQNLDEKARSELEGFRSLLERFSDESIEPELRNWLEQAHHAIESKIELKDQSFHEKLKGIVETEHKLKDRLADLINEADQQLESQDQLRKLFLCELAKRARRQPEEIHKELFGVVNK